jgi:two-component system OmpR family sensor kinase/two-component system sensor histidine kinase BaeS
MKSVLNRLWVRLALGFVLVALLTTGLVTMLINRQAGAQFNIFVINNDLVASGVVDDLAASYTTNAGWRGVEQVFNALATRDALRGPQRRRDMQAAGPVPDLTLTDENWRVIWSGQRSLENRALPVEERGNALPITVNDAVAGYLVASLPSVLQLTSVEQAFLDHLYQSLLQVGLLASGLALLLGVLIARGLAAPLGRLAGAARQIAQGKLNQRVPVQGAEEVAGLATAFNDMAASLQRNETLRRNMVADIAHELRTPLTVIHGSLRALLDDVYPLEKSEIASLYDETITLNRLINDLRELALAEAGQLHLHLEATDLTPLLENTVDVFKTAADEQGVNVVLSLPDAGMPVQADADRVRQVLHNLLSNALRHTPSGGEIRIQLENRPDSARISVTDTGHGISADDLPYVFDRFWRADRSRSRERGGTGLGLAIARQLVQAQGGQIGVESSAGQGSHFWFTLRAAAQLDK